ncbi:MAG TPA: integrase arm-type DNA-binding domain-containing protein [Stellaceae bacterium]|jgi:integrase|nr:integrase arm-type DNA-binding domain-containing protein [Stellaceae bacterium]
MPRFVNRLSQAAVNNAPKGMHADGGGLYLHVNAKGAKSWIFRYMRDGRAREMGLGSLHTIGLKAARERAADRRRELLDDIDPLQVRQAKRHKATLEAAKAITFAECAKRYIAAHKAGWKSPKSLDAWEGTLRDYANPVFGNLTVQAVDTALVVKAIEPIWAEKSETATRVRGRIESILDYATAREWRQGENPARWRGHLDKLLPKKAKVRAVEHHPALPFAEIPGFMETLRQENGGAAGALEFAILTAARTGEVIGARWADIDRNAKLWTIPGARMKGGREHRVPLSDAALAILDRLADTRQGEFIFPGGQAGRPLSNMAMLVLLRRMKRDDLTVHGFRSTFRDWAAERTSFQNEVIEMALAHAIGDKVEASYRRGDLFEKRKRLMEAWGGYCQSTPAAGAVVSLRRS